MEYSATNGKPMLWRLPQPDFIDDKAGKPVAIEQIIGRRPIMAFGNSDGDFEMLEWTTAGTGKRFGIIVHHTDAEREWAYDRASHIVSTDPRSGRGAEARVDRRRHEGRLESDLPLPAVVPCNGVGADRRLHRILAGQRQH